jgi:hypothetical protein
MTKHKKQSKCGLCSEKIEKGKECYFGGNKVCSKCFLRLKTPLPKRVRYSWLDQFLEEVKLRKGI